jgi:hypothetical protein
LPALAIVQSGKIHMAAWDENIDDLDPRDGDKKGATSEASQTFSDLLKASRKAHKNR